MHRIFDKLYCYFYILSEEKVWFANNSFGLYAYAFVAGSLHFLVIGYGHLMQWLFGEVPYLQYITPNKNSEDAALNLIPIVFAILFYLVFAIYFLYKKRGKNLVKAIKKDKESVRGSVKLVGKIYTSLYLFLFLFAFFVILYDSIA